VDLPIQNGGSFHSYVSLPEGMSDYQAIIFQPAMFFSQTIGMSRHRTQTCPFRTAPRHTGLSKIPTLLGAAMNWFVDLD